MLEMKWWLMGALLHQRLCVCVSVCVSVIQAVRRTQHLSLMSLCLMWFRFTLSLLLNC